MQQASIRSRRHSASGSNPRPAPHNGEGIARNGGGFRLRGTCAALTGITAAALLLRLVSLGKESLWWDEAYSVFITGTGGWRYLADRLWHGDANMSLYYALLHIWIGLGRTEFVLRGLSVLFSAATIPVIYLLGRQLFGRTTGVLASLLLALNVFHIEYAQEVRSYALLVLLVTLASLFFVSAVQQPSGKRWTLYVGAIVLGVYSHFFAALVLVAHWSSLALMPRRNVPWRLVALSTCAIVGLLLPLVVFASTNDHVGQIDWIPHPRPDLVARAFSYLAGAAPVSEIHPGGVLFAATEMDRRLLFLLYAGSVAVALVPAGRLRLPMRKSSETWGLAFLLLWLLVPLVLAYLVSLVKPIFVMYYLIVSLPPLVMLAAHGLSRMRPPAASAVAALALVGLAAVQAAAYYHFPKKEDWRGVTKYILARAQPRDALVFENGSREAFEYYRERERETASVAPRIVPLSTALRDTPPRVWLVLAHADDRQIAAVRSRLAVEYTVVDDQRFFHDIRVLLYQAKGVRAFSTLNRTASAGNSKVLGVVSEVRQGRYAMARDCG